MALDPNIILGANGLDVMGAITRGRDMAFQQGQNEFQQAQNQRQNALAMTLQQNGAGLVRGDQGAVNALAAYDPQAAMGFQDAAGERRQLQAKAQQAAAELVAQKGADAARMEAERTEKLLKGAAYFHANGDKVGYDEYVRRVGGDPAQFPFEQFPAIAASAGDVIDVWKTFQPETAKPLTTIGKLQADLKSGLITQDQFNAEMGNRQPTMRTTTIDPRTGQMIISEGAGLQTKTGAVPAGYEQYVDPVTGATTMRPIAGSEAAADAAKLEATKQKKLTNADIAADTVMTSSTRALQAAGSRNFGFVGQGIAEKIPFTDAAEVQRQVGVLKSHAIVSNLQAMRDASPTGGALGAVTAPELQMLANQAGALDPSSPNFARDVADYTRVLLRTIHGNEAGEQAFQEWEKANAKPEWGPKEAAPNGSEAAGSGLPPQGQIQVPQEYQYLLDKY